jgi:hypothetical protein
MLLEGNTAMSDRNWTVGCKPTRYPGIYRTTSGYRVRVRAVDPRTGTQKEANQGFDGITMEQAVLKQAQLRDAIRFGGGVTERVRMKYAHFAKSLFERKLAMGELRSAKTRERWADTQDLHLIPYFGDWFVDAIRKPDIEEWKAAQGRKIERKEYSPNTANGWLRIPLPFDLVEVLREHAEALPEGPMRESDLLFPSEDGRFQGGILPRQANPEDREGGRHPTAADGEVHATDVPGLRPTGQGPRLRRAGHLRSRHRGDAGALQQRGGGRGAGGAGEGDLLGRLHPRSRGA